LVAFAIRSVGLWCFHLPALLHMVLGRLGVARVSVTRQPDNFLDSVVSPVLPNQQIWNSARIVQIPAHKPSRNDWNVLAVESRPGAKEVLRCDPELLRRAFPSRLLPRSWDGAHPQQSECRGATATLDRPRKGWPSTR
jgi:hypothetical protein